MPILAGLRHVLEAALSGIWELAPRRLRQPQWRLPALNRTIDAAPFGAGEWRHGLHS
jgi:hypothetical protein